MKVKKYNKKIEEFDKSKIIKSIYLASQASKYQNIPSFMAVRIADNIEAELIKKGTKIVEASELSDMVENKLMQSSYKDVAKRYITYHYEREKDHVYNSKLLKQFEKKLNGTNIENSNANCDERSFSGRMNEAARVLLKDNALNTMSKKFKDNHNNNEVYTHDLDSYSSGQHNCFESDTEIITSNGIKNFNQFVDGEIITVLSKDGEWRQATVKNYGENKLQKVTLEYCDNGCYKNKININCTVDHRWYLKDGTVTTNLKIGDKLIQLPQIKEFNNIKIESKEDAELWCLGFIIGSGYDYNTTSSVILNNDKLKYIDIFKQAYYTEEKINEESILLYKNSSIQKRQFLKNKLWKILNKKQKQLLFDGYIHSNGTFKENIAISCSTTDERVIEFIKDISCLCGYHIKQIRNLTNNASFKVQITYIEFFTSQLNNEYWVVTHIEELDNKPTLVWCVEEPITHTFTLANGIVTGNCLSIPFDNMFETGVHIKQTDIRPPKSISTAMQQIAVYMQVQSLQQFGGVAATHIDWTMVPSVRWSFYKHFIDGLKYILTEEDYDRIMAEYETDAAASNSTENTETETKESEDSNKTI